VKRREVITLLGGAAAVWPLAARAQQQPLPVVAFANVGSPESRSDRVAAFRKARALGVVTSPMLLARAGEVIE
jgi:putative tryptophan/tyrosine transport system substrate-binding protein